MFATSTNIVAAPARSQTRASGAFPLIVAISLSFAVGSFAAGDDAKTAPASQPSSPAPSRPKSSDYDSAPVTPGLTFRSSTDVETPFTIASGESTVAAPAVAAAQPTPAKKSSGGFDPLSPLGLAAGAAALAVLAGLGWYIVKRQA